MELKKKQDRLIVEKEQIWYGRAKLEKEVFDAYQEVRVVEEDLDAPAKVDKLGNTQALRTKLP